MRHSGNYRAGVGAVSRVICGDGAIVGTKTIPPPRSDGKPSQGGRLSILQNPVPLHGRTSQNLANGKRLSRFPVQHISNLWHSICRCEWPRHLFSPIALATVGHAPRVRKAAHSQYLETPRHHVGLDFYPPLSDKRIPQLTCAQLPVPAFHFSGKDAPEGIVLRYCHSLPLLRWLCGVGERVAGFLLLLPHFRAALINFQRGLKNLGEILTHEVSKLFGFLLELRVHAQEYLLCLILSRHRPHFNGMGSDRQITRNLYIHYLLTTSLSGYTILTRFVYPRKFRHANIERVADFMKKDFNTVSLPAHAPLTAEQWEQILASLPADVVTIVAAVVA